MRELIDNVIQWAKDRNIIEGSTPEKQLEKTAAELIELAVAVGKDSKTKDGAEHGMEVLDGIGDVIVTLIIVAEQTGWDIHSALLAAYNEIKDRRGEMRGGKFVKEEDL